ncbi:DUF695 domain-containing protein [Chitinophaga sp. GbtcB8]|uniref:DUF695 domain-containing protein n=1 Tax=Chitinophaga sp. GbtcB8 TaxID=2824753 RepID=UPI001C3094BA|nr:DUF695 domain-containing protein [Chitinophaga sp. GbtcB8]
MGLLKSIFSKKEEPITSYEDFWNWFRKNEKTFFKVVKERGDIEKIFFDKLSSRLGELKEGFYFLTGMLDDNTVDLVITAEGAIKHIVFVEELIQSAPDIPGWKFTAFKPASDIRNSNLKMAGYLFNSETMRFYANEIAEYPDEIDIVITHDELNEENKQTIINGIYIYLDTYLGELNFATTIDNLKVIRNHEAQQEWIPIEKLKDFLIWRQKEFIEKYEGTRHDTENDNYAMLEAKLKNGNMLLAVINTDLLEWDSKASHPWILNVEIKYGSKNDGGMPNDATYQLLNEIEDAILSELKDYEGYLNIGRQTANSVQEIFFACKDFRKPSKVVYDIKDRYALQIEIGFTIYKDKYWQSFNQFRSS